MLGQFGDRADARVEQRGALADPHARDQQQVVGRAHLLLADRAAEAGAHLLVVPAHRGTVGVVIVEQALQSHALFAVHRDQLINAVVDHHAVAEHEFGFRVHCDPGVGQRVGVGGDLKQRGDFRRAGQLGVRDLVRPVAPHQEVGEPDEAAVEHRGLIDHRRRRVDARRVAAAAAVTFSTANG